MVERIKEDLLYKDSLKLLVKLKKDIYDLVTLKGKHKYVNIQLFKSVGNLKAGQSFGERALIRNEERAASIVCTEYSQFATLDRIEFTACLAQVQKREMKEQVSFFKEFRIFQGLRNNTVERIGLNSRPRDFYRG